MFGAIFGFTRMKILIALILFYFRADVFYHHLTDLRPKSPSRIYTARNIRPCTGKKVFKANRCKAARDGKCEHNLNGVLIKIMVSKCEAKDCRPVINAAIIGELIANV